MNPTTESKPRRPNQIRKKPSCQVSSPAVQLLLPLPPPPPLLAFVAAVTPLSRPHLRSSSLPLCSAYLMAHGLGSINYFDSSLFHMVPIAVSIVTIYYRGDSKSSSGKRKSGSGGGSRCRGRGKKKGRVSEIVRFNEVVRALWLEPGRGGDGERRGMKAVETEAAEAAARVRAREGDGDELSEEEEEER
ncbi:hypothetical protein Drorol1_Dr00019820 [Drosera rotundifolia]